MALAVVVSLLPGCAQLPTSGALPAMSRPARAAIDAYSLDGRIAVHLAAEAEFGIFVRPDGDTPR